MLLELAQWLAKDVRLFNVFNYLTLRAVLACLTALAMSLILGPYVIRKLTAFKIGQAVRDDGPKSHLTKAGTPTMGGCCRSPSRCCCGATCRTASSGWCCW
jgi:phospho-N-acetylmuramoyl-pentapeptide-transferase